MTNEVLKETFKNRFTNLIQTDPTVVTLKIPAVGGIKNNVRLETLDCLVSGISDQFIANSPVLGLNSESILIKFLIDELNELPAKNLKKNNVILQVNNIDYTIMKDELRNFGVVYHCYCNRYQ